MFVTVKQCDTTIQIESVRYAVMDLIACYNIQKSLRHRIANSSTAPNVNACVRPRRRSMRDWPWLRAVHPLMNYMSLFSRGHLLWLSVKYEECLGNAGARVVRDGWYSILSMSGTLFQRTESESSYIYRIFRCSFSIQIN